MNTKDSVEISSKIEERTLILDRSRNTGDGFHSSPNFRHNTITPDLWFSRYSRSDISSLEHVAGNVFIVGSGCNSWVVMFQRQPKFGVLTLEADFMNKGVAGNSIARKLSAIQKALNLIPLNQLNFLLLRSFGA